MRTDELRAGDVLRNGYVVLDAKRVVDEVLLSVRLPDGHVGKWAYPVDMQISVASRSSRG